MTTRWGIRQKSGHIRMAPVGWARWTWPGMRGSRWGIGMTMLITPAHLLKIRAGRRRANSRCCEGVVGALASGPSARRRATMLPQAHAPATLASGVWADREIEPGEFERLACAWWP